MLKKVALVVLVMMGFISASAFALGPGAHNHIGHGGGAGHRVVLAAGHGGHGGGGHHGGTGHTGGTAHV